MSVYDHPVEHHLEPGVYVHQVDTAQQNHVTKTNVIVEEVATVPLVVYDSRKDGFMNKKTYSSENQCLWEDI